MKSMYISDRSHVVNLYRLAAFTFLALCLCFTNAEAANKKKQVGVKTVAKIAKASKAKARVPAAKSQMKVPAGVPTKLPEKAVQSSPPVSSNRAPASLNAGISDSQKSLEIRGQSRNLSMLLVLKNRHENIDFVKPRETYRDEIQKTDF